MTPLPYLCPVCLREGEFALPHEGERWLCARCGGSWPERKGIPLFAQDMYWGEMTQREMMEFQEHIQQDGFEAACHWLQNTEPDRFRFFFDPARADWRFGMEIKPTDRVLDVGCGMGGNTFALCDLVEQVVAFDLSFARVRFVQRRAEETNKQNIQLFVGDLMELPLAEGQFDIIIFNGILEWVGQNTKFDDPHEVQRWVMKKCFRLLRPGGRMYVGIENRFSFTYLFGGEDHIGLPWTSWMPRWLARPYCRWRIGKDYRTYTHGARGYRKLFQEAGFHQVRVLMPYPGYNDQRLLIPFENTAPLRHAITHFMGSLGWKKRLVKMLSCIPGVLALYRYFFFSYDIFGIKPTLPSSTPNLPAPLLRKEGTTPL